MTPFELCKQYRRLIVNRAAEVINYHWDAEFCASQLRELPEKIAKMEGFEWIDPSELTKEEMDDLGFGLWSEENPIHLIPLWLYPFLKEEFSAGNIDDKPPQMIKKSEMDTDVRYGCLAYGVLP